jgi:hypothetical protein
MAVVIVAVKEPEGTHKDVSKVLWLFEDTWTDDNGDTEILLECIIKTQQQIKEILILLPYRVEKVDNLTYLLNDPAFQYGYPTCWLDIYTQYEIEKNGETIVKVNGIEAKVSKIEIEQGLKRPYCSEVIIKFDPPINNETRIFRLALFCKNFIKKSLLKKEIRNFSYGMAPFAVTELENVLLRRRRLNRDAWLKVDKHIISLEIWEKNPIIISVTPQPDRYHYLEKCEDMARFCPPLERMAQRLGVDVMELKKRESFCTIWEFSNVLPSKGQLIDLKYFSSGLKKMLSDHWLSLLALLISLIALFLTILLMWG